MLSNENRINFIKNHLTGKTRNVFITLELTEIRESISCCQKRLEELNGEYEELLDQITKASV